MITNIVQSLLTNMYVLRALCETIQETMQKEKLADSDPHLPTAKLDLVVNPLARQSGPLDVLLEQDAVKSMLISLSGESEEQARQLVTRFYYNVNQTK